MVDGRENHQLSTINHQPAMRVLFFGTSDFAVPSLDALVASGEHEVAAVVTQPDRPQGRGQQTAASPVKRAALRYGLPLLQPRRVRASSFQETARELRPDVLALAAFGQIIPQALLDLPPFGPINVHASLLPAWRGAAPIQYALLNGETETGVTTMRMDATLDTGDILLRRVVPIEEDDTTGTLTPKLAQAGAELLLETLALLQAGRCPRAPQDHAKATYAPPITPDDSRVRWNEPARRIRDRIRALSPRPGVFARIKGKGVKLWAARTPPVPPFVRGGTFPGVVRAVTKEGVEIGAGEGTALLLTEAQPENGRRMPAADWARGLRLMPGDRFAEG
jgi:methionyl-tRNA formyltransferase